MSALGVKYAYYSFGVGFGALFVVSSVLHPMYYFQKDKEYLKMKGYPHPIHKSLRPGGHLKYMKEVIEQWPPKK